MSSLAAFHGSVRTFTASPFYTCQILDEHCENPVVSLGEIPPAEHEGVAYNCQHANYPYENPVDSVRYQIRKRRYSCVTNSL